MPSSSLQLLLFSLSHTLFLSLLSGATQLILFNNCMHDIWPALLASASHPTPRDGGFLLPAGHETLLHLPPGWSGRIWARQGCCFDPHTGKGSCQTGDCAGLLKCGGIGGLPPATLVEITLGTSQSPLHFYDAILVDGFNKHANESSHFPENSPLFVSFHLAIYIWNLVFFLFSSLSIAILSHLSSNTNKSLWSANIILSFVVRAYSDPTNQVSPLLYQRPLHMAPLPLILLFFSLFTTHPRLAPSSPNICIPQVLFPSQHHSISFTLRWLTPSECHHGPRYWQ